MQQLSWSQDKTGTLNGKVWPLTLFTVAYYPGRGHFVAPKLPGLNKTIPVGSEEDGRKRAETSNGSETCNIKEVNPIRYLMDRFNFLHIWKHLTI